MSGWAVLGIIAAIIGVGGVGWVVGMSIYLFLLFRRP